MRTWEVILLAIGLGTDAFSVALSAGTRGVTARRMFRLSWHFGLFQFIMPVLGWLIGRNFVDFLRPVGHYLVAAFLGYVGTKMLLNAFRPGDEEASTVDHTRGLYLVSFSMATSLDAFGVGVGLGILAAEIVFPAVVIGLVAAAMTLMGMLLGDRLRLLIGRRAEAVGGAVLLVLAIRFLVG